MRFVLDSCTALKWVLPEIYADKAIRLRDAYTQKIHELISPEFYPFEVANGLTKAERKKIIQVGTAAPLLANLLQTPPIILPTISLLSRATDISSATRQGVYDCLYVALAEQEQCDLITADDKLIKNLQAQFPFVVHLSTLP